MGNNKARELADWFAMTNGDIENLVDKGLRHKSGVKPLDYLNHWLYIARHFGFATNDDSWGEFEKEFAIIIRRLIRAEQNLKTYAQEAEKWGELVDDLVFALRFYYTLHYADEATRLPAETALARAEKMGVE